MRPRQRQLILKLYLCYLFLKTAMKLRAFRKWNRRFLDFHFRQQEIRDRPFRHLLQPCPKREQRVKTTNIGQFVSMSLQVIFEAILSSGIAFISEIELGKGTGITKREGEFLASVLPWHPSKRWQNCIQHSAVRAIVDMFCFVGRWL